MTVYFRFVEFFKIIDILYKNNNLLIHDTKNAVFMYAYIFIYVCMNVGKWVCINFQLTTVQLLLVLINADQIT